MQFNTIAATNGTPFQVTNNSGTTTGLQSVNGTTSPAFAIQTLATNLDLVFNSFNTANGILDTGEDLNANNMLDAGEDLPDQFVFLTDLDQAGFNPSIVFGNQLIGSTITAAFASGQVVTGTMQAVPGQATASQFVATSTNNGLGNGVAIRAGNESRLRNSVILNNSISQHGGTGLLLQSSESGVIENVLVRGNSILSNGAGTGLSAFGSGIALRTLNNVNAQLNASLINNVISNNSGGAIDASAAGGLMNLARILNNTLDSNGSGISLSATQAGTLAAQLTNNQITNSRRVIAANTSIRSTGDGVIVVADAGTVQLNEIAFNTITGSGGNGLNFSATNAGVIRVTPSEDFNQNGVLDPGEDANEDLDNDGIRDLNEPDSNSDGFLNRGNGNGQLDRGILGNSLTNNAGLAFGVTTTGGTVDLSDVRNTSVVTNTIGTGNFSLVGTNGVLRANFLGNTVLGNATPTGGPGLIVSATGGSFVVNVGGPNAGDGNTFSGNSGAGVAFALSDTGTGSFVIENNTITRIIDDANPVTPFNGDGISVSLVGSTNIVDATAVLRRSDIRGNIIGDLTNANLGLNGSGIAVLASENTTIQDLLIEGNTIGRAGNDNVLLVPSVGGPITGNDDAGIEFDRADDARFDVVNPRPGQTQAVTVRNNIVRNNVGANGISPVDGLNINVMNGIKDDIDFDIRNNQFGGNTGNGLRFTTQADASLATNLTANLIEDNILNGIQMDGVENVANDFETQGGTWIKNTIRNNRRNGIQIFSVSGDIVPLIIGQVGIDPLDGVSLGNTIENNGLSGITISGGGFSQMNNNLIQRNGLHGININADNIGFRADTLRNNRILSNAGDGLQFRNRSGIGGLGYLLAFGNSIDGNAGRGVDILSQGIATSNIRFGNDTAAGANSITSNGLEAFYVVNTASFSQNNTDDSSVPLQADGSVGASQANMVLDVSRNFINSNNNTGDFIGGGLVIRAGTNFGGSGPFTIADPTGTSGGTTAVGTNSSTFGNGRINARVINNELQGNLGDDVYIESFTSTVDPVVSAGTWDAMVFTVMAYQSDPLARLNLVFRGNVGNSINVTTGQFFASANPGQSPSVGAFYANGEADFKSRLNTATPGGPFAVADRRRNAQRIPYRDEGTTQLPPLPLNSPEFGFYQYPGMGASTFRVESDFDLSGFQNGDSFELDFLPNDPFPINGLQVPFVPPIRFGEQRFGWGAATPGTFQFDQAFAIPQLGTGTNQVQAPQANGELDGFVRPPELGN